MNLCAEVDAFLAATGMRPTTLGKGALNNPSFVRDLRGGRQVRTDNARRVREFMRANRGVVEAAAVAPVVTLTVDVPATAMFEPTVAARPARAPVRRITPEYAARLRGDASPAERVATMCVATVPDLIATVKRQWPGQWQRIVDAARAAGTLPGAMLCHVIERGLEADA